MTRRINLKSTFLALHFLVRFSRSSSQQYNGVHIDYQSSRDFSQPDLLNGDLLLQCYDSKYEKQVECFEENTLPSIPFSTAVVDFFDKHILSQDKTIFNTLVLLSHNVTVHRIEMTFSGQGEYVEAAGDDLFDLLGGTLDAFITPRPWWFIEREPFSWQKLTNNSSCGSNSDDYYCNKGERRSPLKVVLQRYRHDFELYFRLLSDIQYPLSEERCSNSTLVVDTSDCKLTGWGGVIDMHKGARTSTPFAVYSMYSSVSNDVNDSTAFITGSDCPQQRNKWLCAFLPMTNCSLPLVLTGCREKNCITSIKHSIGLSILFDRAATDGQVLDNALRSNKLHAQRPHSSYQQQMWQETRSKLRFKYIAPRGYQPPFESFKRLESNVPQELYTFYFLLRKNSFYRSRVAQMITSFRDEAHFPASKRCVAVHIRRGDRLRSSSGSSSLNITEMCRKYHIRAGELGCYGVPFASITIRHVIDAARRLVGSDDVAVKNLVVATDDSQWLAEQRMEAASYAPDWNIYHMQPPTQLPSLPHDGGTNGLYKGYYSIRWGSTDSGVFLQAQIHLLQQCEAFVGHMVSAMAKLMYHNMCTAHKGRQALCPPGYDLGEIKSLMTNRTAQQGWK